MPYSGYFDLETAGRPGLLTQPVTSHCLHLTNDNIYFTLNPRFYADKIDATFSGNIKRMQNAKGIVQNVSKYLKKSTSSMHNMHEKDKTVNNIMQVIQTYLKFKELLI